GDADLVCEFYGIVDGGNWHEGDGASVLNVRIPLDDFARMKNTQPDELQQRLDAARARLLEARSRRPAPLKDDKVITSWNGLAITAMARAAQTFDDARYEQAAIRAAEFILGSLRDASGDLLHVWRAGRARVRAFLDDYANMTLALIDLYETTFDERWLREAERLAARMIELFADAQTGGFSTTDGQDRTLVARVKDFHDGATPSGNAQAVRALQRLGLLLNRDDFQQVAWKTLCALVGSLQQLPAAHHQMLCALAFH